VFVSDPDSRSKTAPEVLGHLYDLTPAESRVVALLLEGNSIEGAAERLAIRPLTARTHLKRVFQKTGVTRQSDLVRLVMSGPSLLRRD
jgi:DNA-binding CsgD family transcriptional regulator